ncbi:MAG: anaerobic ribonucleoside-triphosphate reductase activating protein [Bacteroidales bacterium]|jgi:anaerobic ribonucleoside-triphosphate reductase activating protein|nr:anaerobic ribonucleoside-triphosphate reductase activating protein [Bacteroidales bacterium]
MEKFISVLKIIPSTTADGEGFRTSIYFAGCSHHCRGCHNPQAWKKKNGTMMSIEEIMAHILPNEFENVTFSGGDPLYQVEAITRLAIQIKIQTVKTIWCYSGYTYEQILASPRLSMILPHIDVLVDGPFLLEKKTNQIPFVGSSNQRVIMLTK